MDSAQCRRLLGSARVARLGTVGGDGAPHLVPVVFALVGDRLVTAVDGKPKRTRALRRLENIRRHGRVSVLADHYEEDWARLWWVRADGDALVHEARSPVGAEALAALRQKYPQYAAQPPPGPVVVIEVDTWVGWSATASENRAK
jgi:PPOX class probable F420-dependent enzyme